MKINYWFSLLISQSIAVSPTAPPTTAPPLACAKDEKFKKGSWREIFCDGSVEKGPAKGKMNWKE